MRNPHRIPRIMETLECFWKQHPDLRLGQLIDIIAARILGHAPNQNELFAIEDSQLEDYFSKAGINSQAQDLTDRFGGIVEKLDIKPDDVVRLTLNKGHTWNVPRINKLAALVKRKGASLVVFKDKDILEVFPNGEEEIATRARPESGERAALIEEINARGGGS